MKHIGTNRTATGACPPSGSRGAGTQKTNPRAEIIRTASGSIVSIPALEPLDFAEPGFNKPLLFAFFLNFGILGLLALTFWALFF